MCQSSVSDVAKLCQVCEVGYNVRASDEPPHHHNNQKSPTSTRDNFTTMDPVSDAIAEIDAREPGDKLSYRET
jgi:hypothetical protein